MLSIQPQVACQINQFAKEHQPAIALTRLGNYTFEESIEKTFPFHKSPSLRQVVQSLRALQDPEQQKASEHSFAKPLNAVGSYLSTLMDKFTRAPESDNKFNLRMDLSFADSAPLYPISAELNMKVAVDTGRHENSKKVSTESLSGSKDGVPSKEVLANELVDALQTWKRQEPQEFEERGELAHKLYEELHQQFALSSGLRKATTELIQAVEAYQASPTKKHEAKVEQCVNEWIVHRDVLPDQYATIAPISELLFNDLAYIYHSQAKAPNQ